MTRARANLGGGCTIEARRLGLASASSMEMIVAYGDDAHVVSIYAHDYWACKCAR